MTWQGHRTPGFKKTELKGTFSAIYDMARQNLSQNSRIRETAIKGTFSAIYDMARQNFHRTQGFEKQN